MKFQRSPTIFEYATHLQRRQSILGARARVGFTTLFPEANHKTFYKCFIHLIPYLQQPMTCRVRK